MFLVFFLGGLLNHVSSSVSQFYVSCWKIEALLQVLIQNVITIASVPEALRPFLIASCWGMSAVAGLEPQLWLSVGGSKFPVPNKSSAFLSAAAKSNVTCSLPALPFQPFWVFCFWDWLRTLNLYSGVALTQEAERKISFFLLVNRKKISLVF